MIEGPGWWAIAFGSILVLASSGVIAATRAGAWRDVLLAPLRMTVQLIALGFVLNWLLSYAGLWGAIAWTIVMIVVAGHVSGKRGKSIPGSAWIATGAIAISTIAPSIVLLLVGAIHAEPQELIPVNGMIIASAMQGASLTLSRTVEEARRSAPAIEAALALGLSPRRAFRSGSRAAIRNALVPIVDSQKVVGLVTLPGAMTGLILAGVLPWAAVQYQIVVMYALMAAWTFAVTITSQLAERAIFDDAERVALR